MKDCSTWSISDPEKSEKEIIFDEDEFNVINNLKTIWLYVFISFSVSLTCFGNILVYYERMNIIFYIFSFILVLIIPFMIYKIISLVKSKKENEKTFYYSEIKIVIIEPNKLLIEFKNGTNLKMRILKNKYFEHFIEIIRKNKIEIKENNKR